MEDLTKDFIKVYGTMLSNDPISPLDDADRVTIYTCPGCLTKHFKREFTCCDPFDYTERE